MTPSLAVLANVLLEWRAVRSMLTGGEKREFARWLCRVHPEIVVGFDGEAARFRLSCKELQRGGAWPKTRGIGEAAVRRYLPALHRRYQALPEESRGRFLDFLNEVLERCETERGLARYLEGG